MAIFAIGDIHGCSATLAALIEKLPLTAEDRLIFLGDYVDEGPDSKGVIAYLLDLRRRYECVFLCGNHDHFFRCFVEGNPSQDPAEWRALDGVKTIRTYVPSALEDIAPADFLPSVPEDHREFLSSMQPHYLDEEMKLAFVHGGLIPNFDRQYEDWDAILADCKLKTKVSPGNWFYDEKNYCWPPGRVVFGHRPVFRDKQFDEPWMSRSKVAIDTGCGYFGDVSRQHKGRLTACRFSGHAGAIETEFFHAECVEKIERIYEPSNGD